MHPRPPGGHRHAPSPAPAAPPAEPEPELAPEAEPEPEPELEPELQPAPEPEADPEPVSAPEPEPEPAPQPVVQPIAATRPAPTAAPAHPLPSPFTASEPVNLRFQQTALQPGAIPRAVELGAPSSTNDVREYIRFAAEARGIDPDVALRVALSEGGLTPVTWTGDYGSSFGPFQLHYGNLAPGANSAAGLGDAFTSETGLRATDPATWRQQVDWSLDRAIRDGWTPWHGAARVGIGPYDGMVFRRDPSALRGHVDVPNQFASQLSSQDAYAACGPVAAVAVARWLGRNPTVAEALERAKQNGWTVNGGMNGIANEKRLLDAMNIPARMETQIDWQHLQKEASAGSPVVLSTPKHYWVIDDYDMQRQLYHVGQSGLVMKGGADWMSAAQIQAMGNGVNGALYVDNPLVTTANFREAKDGEPKLRSV